MGSVVVVVIVVRVCVCVCVWGGGDLVVAPLAPLACVHTAPAYQWFGRKGGTKSSPVQVRNPVYIGMEPLPCGFFS